MAYLVAASPEMRTVLEWARRVGATDLAVLLLGESGVGKELVAHAVHDASGRHQAAFVPVNCGAFAEPLLATELFGHRRGAFTGAVADRMGLLEQAHRGTLFLDEVGEMSPQMQVALLRFLEDGEVRRVGDTRGRPMDVRVIAATNRPLDDDVGRGRFRTDLYYRLGVATCTVPPLRDRPADLEALVERWVPEIAAQLAPAVREVTGGARARLRKHAWPGNVRELRNVLERAVLLARESRVDTAEVTRAIEDMAIPASGAGAEPGERERLLAALNHHHWKLGPTAAALGMSRTTLWRRMRDLDLS